MENKEWDLLKVTDVLSGRAEKQKQTNIVSRELDIHAAPRSLIRPKMAVTRNSGTWM